MKTKQLILYFVVLTAFQNCCFYGDCSDDNDEVFYDYSQYEPIYLTRGDLDNSIALLEPQVIANSGKIYVKDNLLFVAEKRKGFHVFDNTNPANPIKIRFLAVPGSTDLAVRNNILYLNQATDLVTARFNLEQNSLAVTKRVENTFPILYSPDGYYPFDAPESSIVVDWKLKNQTP